MTKNSKPAICVLHNSIRTVWIFRRSYIKQLLNSGWEVHCISPSDDGYAIAQLKDMGVVLHLSSARSSIGKMIELNFKYLQLRISLGEAPVVFCHFISSVVLFSPTLICNRKDTCFIEGIGTYFSRHPVLLKICRMFLHSFVRERVFMNENERNVLGIRGDRVLNGIGVDLQYFIPDDIGSQSSEVLELLSVGRLVSDKGVRECVSVLEHLLQLKIKVRLTFVGDIYPGNPGSLSRNEIKRYEEKYGSAIRFTGAVNDIRHYYQRSDVLLLLSAHEGFPVVVMEANACGLPAIVFDVPGSREAVVDGVNGVIFPYKDVDSIVEFLANRLDEIDAGRCRCYAEAHFQQSSRVRDILRLAEDLVI